MPGYTTSIIAIGSYINIYIRHEQDTGEIMGVCEDAVTCNPTQLFLWEMYINYAGSAPDKLALCDRAIYALSAVPPGISFFLLYFSVAIPPNIYTSVPPTR